MNKQSEIFVETNKKTVAHVYTHVLLNKGANVSRIHMVMVHLSFKEGKES